MNPRLMFWRNAGAVLIMIMLAMPASSQPVKRDADQRAEQRRECKPNLIAAGKTKYRQLTFAREMRGEGAAMADAVANWQRDASAKHGSQWMLWDKAEERNVACAVSRSGTVSCVLEARPCGGEPDKSPEEEPEQATRSCDEYPRARILEAQRWMNGCSACGHQIRVDGQCGRQTQRCLRTFQASRFGREQGLDVGAAPDMKTILALREFCRL